MPKKRTRKEKVKSQLKKITEHPVASSGATSVTATYSLEGAESVSNPKNSRVSPAKTEKALDLQTFFGYDPDLIRRDLLRTVVCSVVVFGLLGVIAYLL